MKLQEFAENLGKTAEAIARLGKEPKPVQRRLVEPMSWNEVARLDNATRLSMQDFVTGDDGLIYLRDSEANRELIEKLYGSYLSKLGTSPIVRQTTLKNGQPVIDLPKTHAHREIASSVELRKQVPKLYGEKPTEKGEPDYLKMGLGPQEILTEFALGRLPSLHEQERLKNSQTFGGRIKNVEKDVANLVGEKISVTGQRIGASAKNLVMVEAPKAGIVLAKSAGETLKAAKEEAVLLKDLTAVGVKRGVVDVAALALTVESAAEKAAKEAADAAQVGAIDLTATVISKGIIVILKNPKF